MKLHALEPGDKMTQPDGSWGILIAKVFPHPLYLNLGLFIWRLHDGTISLDALNPHMVIDPLTVNNRFRAHHLKEAIFPIRKVRRKR